MEDRASGGRDLFSDDDDSVEGAEDFFAGVAEEMEEDEDEQYGEEEDVRDDERAQHRERWDAQTDASTQNVLQMGLDEMPGFDKKIMGDDITPQPAIFQTGLPGYWAPWNTTSSPFREGNEPRPARVLCITVPLEFIAKDAARIGEWETLTDERARARQVTTAALLGMLTTGTAKGWTCTDEHTELTDASDNDKQGENFSNLKKRLNGNVKTYTYKPYRDEPFKEGQPDLRDLTCMQFGWFLEELYNPDASKVVAVRILKLVYCASHEDDRLWGHLIDETSDITRAGNINAIPEALRKPKLMQQNKLQRSQINDENLEETASTQWKRIDSMSALTRHLLHYAGATDSSRGRPLYADMAKDVAAGCADRPLKGHDRWGGKHPLGPSVALNFKRFCKPNHVHVGHPGVNVCIAGAVDAAGQPLKILQAQCNPNNYFDSDGTFRPPDEVVELGAMWACHDNSVKNIFNVPFPRPVHGSVVPEDVLLKAYFDLRKNDDKMLRRTQRGDNPKSFEEVRDVVEVAFNSYTTERDAVAAAISKGILNTEMLAYDSIDKTVAEQERLDRRAYDKKHVDKVGDMWVLEPRQIFRDISLELERIFGMLDEADKRERINIATKTWNSAKDRREAQMLRQKLHSKQVDACIRLGLRRFEHAYGSKKLSGTIPPGWYDICHTGLRKALKEAAEVGIRKAAADDAGGRKVDPDHTDAKAGTANLAFTHDIYIVCKDLNTWGHWRSFLMHMLSAGLKIQGNDVRLMLEAWLHAFEPFQEVSFYYLMCGGPGMGKSMRATRLKKLLCKNWVRNGAQQSSAKSGMNGGMDFLCGRLVYYDEVSQDFSAASGDRIEYLKTITMEQRADVQRTVRTMGSNGLETFTTLHIETLHFESHMMSTNCGPMGIRAKDEVGTDRTALTDRSFAQTVKANEIDKKNDGEFDLEKASIAVKDKVNRIRVVSCLVAYGLVFIKHLPHCEPNITYARELTDKWDDILYEEFNLPHPSRRKKLKRKMLFHLFAMEAATVEKILFKQTAIDFKDMLPDENGMLSGFCIDMMVDVIRSLQRCLDHETILNAWSHNLAHSAPTASHTLELKTVLAQLHGEELDNHTLTGAFPRAPPKPSKPSKPPSKPSSSTSPPPASDDDVVGNLAAGMASDEPQAPSEADTQRGEMDASAEELAAAEAAEAAATAAAQASAASRRSVPLEPARAPDGRAMSDEVHIKGLMENGMTRRDCGRLANQLEAQRQMRADYSSRLASRSVALVPPVPHAGNTVLDEVAAAMTDSLNDQGEAVHEHSSTGIKRNAKHVAAAIMPTVQDVLASGIDDQFLRDILQGNQSSHFGNREFYHLLGLKRNLAWDYELVNNNNNENARGGGDASARQAGGGDAATDKPTSSNKLLSPAEFDFNWAIHKSFTNGKASAGAGDGKKTVWTHAANMIKAASANARNNFFSLLHLENMTMETIRDTLFQMQLPSPEYQVRVPIFNHVRAGFLDEKQMLSNTNTITEGTNPQYIHPPTMFQKGQKDPITGHPVMAEDYATPVPMKRPFDVAFESGYQSRLDHLNRELALPMVATPVNFTRGVFIKEARNHNGIYFNKWIAREHANFVVEASVFMSRIPGIAGGDFMHVPDSFLEPSSRERKRLRAPVVQPVAVEAPPAAAQRTGDAPMPTGELPDEPDSRQDGIYDEEGEEGDLEDDEVDDAEAALVDKPKGVSAADKHVTEQPVREAGAATAAPTVAQPGAAKVAAAMSVEEDARIPSMTYDWDMLQTFLTYKMAGTLHHDIEEYVQNMHKHYPSVFGGEDISETLRNLPQVSLRFPGLCDTDGGLKPLSVKLSLTKTRFEDLGRKRKREEDGGSSDLTKASVHSISNGRAMKHDDPEVRAFDAEQRGGGDGNTLKGNLFARSSWLHFTLAQLDRRGMFTDAEAGRVHDQGICLRQRVAHAASVQGGKMREILGFNTDLEYGTFEAIERIKRETGADKRKKRTRKQMEEDEDEELGLAGGFLKPTIGEGSKYDNN